MFEPLLQSKFETFFTACADLALFIEAHRNDLINILINYETHETAEDEIDRSLTALRGLADEMSTIHKPLQNLNIATIFPLNLPLYSLIIFGIAPSVFADNVFIRPPEVMHELLTELWNKLGVSERFPQISLKPSPRQVFVQLYANECDVIIFTGRYENALAIHKECPYALLVYNGSGVNPFILFENADVDLAVHKAVEMRCFNSGQDCAGPDAFFVPETLAESFIEKLKAELVHIKVGDTHDPSVKIGPTMKKAYIEELRAWIAHEKANIVFGGQIEEDKNLVHPTIVKKVISPDETYDFHEFFAPYFNVMIYKTIEDLEHVLETPAFRDRGMYISVFGDNPEVEAKLNFVQLLKNVIVNDVEQGNHEYGGFGARANFLLYGDTKLAHPVLISRDMHAMLNL